MIKSVLKEICIMLLLCIAIVLLLGVIFYDYIPTNKAIPNKLSAYETPENVQNELSEQIMEETASPVNYTINGADLKLYKQTNSYVAGKPDPFSASIISNDNTNNVGTGNNNNSNNNNGNGNNNSNSNNNNNNNNNNSNNYNNSNNNNNNNSNNNNNNNSSSETSTGTDPNSTGTFFNNTGLK